MNKLEENMKTPDDSDLGYFLEVDLRYPDDMKEKTKSLPVVLENIVIPVDKNNDYMKKIKPKIIQMLKIYYVISLTGKII